VQSSRLQQLVLLVVGSGSHFAKQRNKLLDQRHCASAAQRKDLHNIIILKPPVVFKRRHTCGTSPKSVIPLSFSRRRSTTSPLVHVSFSAAVVRLYKQPSCTRREEKRARATPRSRTLRNQPRVPWLSA
jgi:hypothetical protein